MECVKRKALRSSRVASGRHADEISLMSSMAAGQRTAPWLGVSKSSWAHGGRCSQRLPFEHASGFGDCSAGRLFKETSTDLAASAKKVVIFNHFRKACKKSAQWQQALHLLSHVHSLGQGPIVPSQNCKSSVVCLDFN